MPLCKPHFEGAGARSDGHVAHGQLAITSACYTECAVQRVTRACLPEMGIQCMKAVRVQPLMNA